MKNFSKNFGISTILYLLLIVVNTLWELFHLSTVQSSFTTTPLGISIDNTLTSSEITTSFGLTIRTLVVYIIFLSFICILSWIFRRKNDN